VSASECGGIRDDERAFEILLFLTYFSGSRNKVDKVCKIEGEDVSEKQPWARGLVGFQDRFQ